MSLRRRERLTGWVFALPSLITLGAVIAVPLGFSLSVSFFAYTFINPSFSVFLGFENYMNAFSDPYFWNSLWVTLKFVVLVVSIEFTLGFIVALMLNRDIRFKGVYYTILTMPMVMSPVAVGLIWKMLLHPDLGVLNYFLGLIGIEPINWLGDPTMAFWSVLMVDVWQQISFMILLLLAGLVSLPKEPFEAATIDGASEFQKLFYITIPLMKPVILAAVVIRTIFAFRTYDLIYVLTRGGPGVSTDVLSYFIYRKTFMGLNLAEAAATSYVLLGVVLLLVVFMFKIITSERKVVG
ncbi:MAG: sugar ABC transporter permease [Thermotoga sp.]|nr:MAG: sugar ABC transporter permease [Thermotoga sp.]